MKIEYWGKAKRAQPTVSGHDRPASSGCDRFPCGLIAAEAYAVFFGFITGEDKRRRNKKKR
jgi:hypothetical protein